MNDKQSSAGSNNGGNGVSTLARYLYWGAGVGIISAIAMLFVIVYFYGQNLGLSPGQCTVLSCVMTILLSQPAGVVGILAGAGTGALCGYLGHWHRHS